MIGSNLMRRVQKQRGFALLVALVLSSVAAAVTVTLTALAYKSLLLSAAAQQSQYAFYAADAALDCALFYDNASHVLFPYGGTGTASFDCAGVTVTLTPTTANGQTVYQSAQWFTVNGTHCAHITIYKSASEDSDHHTGFLYADGTDAKCSDLANPRAVERGLKAIY